MSRSCHAFKMQCTVRTLIRTPILQQIIWRLYCGHILSNMKLPCHSAQLLRHRIFIKGIHIDFFFYLGTLPTAHFHAKIRFFSHLFFLCLNGFKKNHGFKESRGRMLYKALVLTTAKWIPSTSRALS